MPASQSALSQLTVIVRDQNRKKVLTIQDAVDPQWEFELPGGCSQAQFKWYRPIENRKFFGTGYRIEFWYAGACVWAGYQHQSKASLDTAEYIAVDCRGYSNWLKQRIIANLTVAAGDSGAVLKTFLAAYLGQGAPSPLADVVFGSFATTGWMMTAPVTYTLKTLDSAVNELSAMGQDAQGNPYDWFIVPAVIGGVQQPAVFTYRPAITAANQFCVVGKDVEKLEIDSAPSDQIQNYLYGTGTINGTGLPVKSSVENATSITRFGQSDGQVSINSVYTTADLNRALQGILTRTSLTNDRGVLYLYRPNDKPTPLTTISIGDVISVVGTGYTDRITRMVFTLGDAGLKLQAELAAAAPNLLDFFGVRPQQQISGALDLLSRNIAQGSNTGVLPFAIGRSVLASGATIPT